MAYATLKVWSRRKRQGQERNLGRAKREMREKAKRERVNNGQKKEAIGGWEWSKKE